MTLVKQKERPDPTRAAIHMEKRYLSTLICCFLFAITLNALAAPIRPIGPVDVSGTISEIKWVPEEKVRGVQGMSGSLGHDRTRSAHFLVTLTDYDGVNAETARRMTGYLNRTAFKGEKQQDKPSFILLKINHNDKNYLRKGMKIRVIGYEVRGDEGGTWTYHDKVEIPAGK